MDERIWALPGPRTLITDTLGEIQRRRHVSIVLPSVMSNDTVTDGLAASLIEESNRALRTVRVSPDPEAESLLDVVSRAVVYGDTPATVPELLCHREAADTVAVVVATDLPESQQLEFPKLMERLERDTHTLPREGRLTVVVIGERRHLPHFAGGETSDVALAALWWWNRIARWDVAAYISHIKPFADETRILSDIRAETIVEVARWELELAEKLARSWMGDPEDLAGFLGGLAVKDIPAEAAEGCGPRPQQALLHLWDRGVIDGWHDTHSTSAMAISDSPRQLSRLVWAAQARIVLPWIEQLREQVQERTVQRLGRRRFQAALNDLFTTPPTNSDLVEIGALRKIVDIRIGTADPRLRSAARRLHFARNELAHLRPLKLSELRELVAACRGLT